MDMTQADIGKPVMRTAEKKLEDIGFEDENIGFAYGLSKSFRRPSAIKAVSEKDNE